MKDTLENRLKKLFCEEGLALSTAQSCISKNWICKYIPFWRRVYTLRAAALGAACTIKSNRLAIHLIIVFVSAFCWIVTACYKKYMNTSVPVESCGGKCEWLDDDDDDDVAEAAPTDVINNVIKAKIQ